MAVSPNVRDLRKQIAEGDKVFTQAKGLPEAQREVALAKVLDLLTRSHTKSPPTATSGLMVPPLVSSIWIGALIVSCGVLTPLWPAPRRARRPAAARYAAR